MNKHRFVWHDLNAKDVEQAKRFYGEAFNWSFEKGDSGPYLHIQFHAELEPTLSLEAAHEIVVAAENRIRTEFPTADIIIHPDPKGRAEPHGHEHLERAHVH